MPYRNSQTPPPGYLSTNDALKTLNMARRTLDRHVRNGDVDTYDHPAYFAGRGVLFKREDVDALKRRLTAYDEPPRKRTPPVAPRKRAQHG